MGHEESQNAGKVHYNRLVKYTTTRTIPAISRRKHLNLHSKQISDLFTLNLILSSLHTLKTSPGLSEAALDALCVSGLIHFSPSEGVPLNLAARMGRRNVLSMFEKYLMIVPFSADVCGSRKPRSLLSDENFGELFNCDPAPANDSEVSAKNQSLNKSLVDIFASQKPQLALLNKRQLRMVGLTRGYRGREIFLLPAVLLASFVTLMITLCLVLLVCFL